MSALNITSEKQDLLSNNGSKATKTNLYKALPAVLFAFVFVFGVVTGAAGVQGYHYGRQRELNESAATASDNNTPKRASLPTYSSNANDNLQQGHCWVCGEHSGSRKWNWWFGYGDCPCHEGWGGTCCETELNPPAPKEEGIIYGSLGWPWNSDTTSEDREWLKSFKNEVPKPNKADVDSSILNPIIVFGGLASGTIEAKLTGITPNKIWCPSDSDWYKIWVSVVQMIPFVTLECTMDNLVPILSDDGKWGNRPGIETRTVDWGGVGSTIGVGPFYYFSHLFDSLKEYGYVSGETLHTAPYDWRFAPGAGQDEWLEQTRNLIEETVANNGGRPADLIGHSMGCLMALDLLNLQTEEWRDHYVRKFVSQGCPWGGSANFVQSSASGYALGVPLLPPSILWPVQSAAPCGVWMYPTPDLWADDELIVRTPSKDYTVANLDELLTDVGLPDSRIAYETVQQSSVIRRGNFADNAPLVDTYNLYGVGLASDESFEYAKDFNGGVSDPPKALSQSKGDGLVSIRSLERAKMWKDAHDKKGVGLHSQKFPCAEHISMTHNIDVVDLTVAILLGDFCKDDEDCDIYKDGWDALDCGMLLR